MDGVDPRTMIIDVAGTAGLAVAIVVYLLLSLVVGARLSLGRLAAERLTEDAGLPEALDPDSRAWACLETLRPLSLATIAILVGFGPPRAFGPWAAVGTVAALVALVRLNASLLAPRYPEPILRTLLPLVRGCDVVLGPLFGPLARAHEALYERHRRRRAAQDDDAKDEQLEEYILDAEEEGLLAKEQTKLMREIADVGDAVVKEVMTPRTEIDSVAADATLSQVVERFIEARHSRLPVAEGSLDRVIGVVQVRDLVHHMRANGHSPEADTRQISLEGATKTAREIMREVQLVPPTKPVLELLREFQRTRQQIAMIVDEFGGTAGLVTLEDLMEEIVGEIRDEYEPPGEPVRPDGQGGLVAEGLMSVDDLATLLDVELPENGVDSVGGLVLSELGRIPRVGERVQVGPLILEVVRMDGRRIDAVRVSRKTRGLEESEEEESQ
jgi:CBS domain containing-hemolysin-like protein